MIDVKNMTNDISYVISDVSGNSRISVLDGVSFFERNKETLINSKI